MEVGAIDHCKLLKVANLQWVLSTRPRSMAQALLDVSLGNGFSMQIFSQDLHLSDRSQPVVQFRVRDTQRVRGHSGLS